MQTDQDLRVQGRSVSPTQLAQLQRLIDEHASWSRHRVAKELCTHWRWQTPLGQLKTFAARSLLLKLEQAGALRLPPVRTALRRRPWGVVPAGAAAAALAPPGGIIDSLASLQPLQWDLCPHGSPERVQSLACLQAYHYLGCNRPVGTHLLYRVRDARQRDLAVHLVGAAAWHCAARDAYLGWNAAERAAHLPCIGNHSRFLILPWVRVPNLASHLLGGLARRIVRDWRQQHGWTLRWLESFVEMGRFTGKSYTAANWQCVGQTTGRTRQEKAHLCLAPRKSVWLYRLGGRLSSRPTWAAHDGGARA